MTPAERLSALREQAAKLVAGYSPESVFALDQTIATWRSEVEALDIPLDNDEVMCGVIGGLRIAADVLAFSFQKFPDIGDELFEVLLRDLGGVQTVLLLADPITVPLPDPEGGSS